MFNPKVLTFISLQPNTSTGIARLCTEHWLYNSKTDRLSMTVWTYSSLTKISAVLFLSVYILSALVLKYTLTSLSMTGIVLGSSFITLLAFVMLSPRIHLLFAEVFIGENEKEILKNAQTQTATLSDVIAMRTFTLNSEREKALKETPVNDQLIENIQEQQVVLEKLRQLRQDAAPSEPQIRV